MKIWSLFKSRSPQRSDSLNQSFTDLLSEDDPQTKEFFSVQNSPRNNQRNKVIKLQRSMSPQMRKEYEVCDNFSSVMNNPKEGGYLTGMLKSISGKFQETGISDLEISNDVQKKVITETIAMINKVRSKDLEPYIKRVEDTYAQYLHYSTRKSERQQDSENEKESINMEKFFVYFDKNVPGFYKDEKFVFKFDLLLRDEVKLKELSEEISGYLDTVEINLMYQIRKRFSEFMDMILKLNKMESKINICYLNIESAQAFSTRMKTQYITKGIRIIKKKKQFISMQKTLKILELIKVVSNTLPTLRDLIEEEKFTYAVKIVNNSQQTFSDDLKQLKCMKSYQKNFQGLKNELKEKLNLRFIDMAAGYMSQMFEYSTEMQNSLSDSSILEESFIGNMSKNDSIKTEVTEGEQESQKKLLHWYLTPQILNTEIEEQILKSFIQNIDLSTYKIRPYKKKIFSIIKQTNENFISNMKDFLQYLDFLSHKTDKKKEQSVNFSANKEENLVDTCEFELFIKLMTFYFQMFKQAITFQLELNQKLSLMIMEHFGGIKKLTDKKLKYLEDLLENLGQIGKMMAKYFLDKSSKLIKQKSFQNVSISDFSKFNNMLTTILNFFQNDFPELFRIESSKLQELPAEIITSSSVMQTIAAQLKLTEFEKLQRNSNIDFYSTYHKKKKNDLIDSLEQDKWQPADIPFGYTGIFTYLLLEEEVKEITEVDDLESLLKTSRDEKQEEEKDEFENLISLVGKEKESGRDDKNIIRIIQTELIFQGQSYRVTYSFLLLIKILFDYLNIQKSFPDLAEQAASSIFEMVQLYNSYSIHLILGGGFQVLEVVTTVTAKMLAISALCVSLLQKITFKLNDRIKCSIPKQKQEWVVQKQLTTKKDLRNHQEQIYVKLQELLLDKIKTNSLNVSKQQWGNLNVRVNNPSQPTALILIYTKQLYMALEDVLLHEDLIELYTNILQDIETFYIPVFEDYAIINKTAAQRIKDELEYFLSNLKEIVIMKYIETESIDRRVQAIIEDKCMPKLRKKMKSKKKEKEES